MGGILFSSLCMLEQMTGLDLPRIITVDGGAGEGKGTATKIWAEMLKNFIILEGGTPYRTIALFAERNPALFQILQQSREAGQEVLAHSILETFKLIRLRYNQQGVLQLNNELLDKQIRTKSIDALVPDVAAIPVVREYAHHLMQETVSTVQEANKGIIAEGRIMGTVVFPDADLKFFFKTPVEVRAKRRFDQKIKNGEDITYEDVLQSLKLRDKKDQERDTEPLRPAKDAIVIDTSFLHIEDYAGLLIEHLTKRARNNVQALIG